MNPALLLLAASAGAPPEPVKDLKLPPGFTARLYAGHELAPDISTMTLDYDGRVLVAGPGYVRVLDGVGRDGVADRALTLLEGLKDSPMGLLAEGDSLFVVTDGGLQRYRSYDGATKLKGPPETILALKTTGEHDAHAVRRGPDGWLYLLCGNMAGVRKETITGDRSPVKEPVAGTLVRISPDFKTVEVVADGFRNPYSFDFNLDGEPFTYDSDNERCVGLPWYEGCRFYHIVPGGNYGWRSPQLSQMWRKPPYFPDVVPPVCDTGRGSPTGVACYRHTAFPPLYLGDFFLADWTFGRIYHVLMKPSGSSYFGKLDVFAEATGTSGFAPTALAVHPKTGELFVSTGGRGTRGGVYAIRYDKAPEKPRPLPAAKRSHDFDKERANQWFADSASDNPRARRVALEMILRWWNEVPWGKPLTDAVKLNLSDDDPLIRRAAARVGSQWFVELKVTDALSNLHLALEQARSDPKWSLEIALRTLEDDNASGTELLLALRVVHLAFGDLTARDAVGTTWEGYTFRARVPRREADKLIPALQAQSERYKGPLRREVSLEIARVLGALGKPAAEGLSRLTLWHINKESPYRDDFHYLLAYARCAEFTEGLNGGGLADDFFAMLAKAKRAKVFTDRHWPLRIEELVGKLVRSIHNFSSAVTRHDDFGRPDHAHFAGKLTQSYGVAERFIAAAKKDKNYQWTPAAVGVLGWLPREDREKWLRELWHRPGLEDAIIRELAREPSEADRDKFVAGLKSLDPDVVWASARVLAKFQPDRKADVYVNAIRALRRIPDEKLNTAIRESLWLLLQKYTGQKIEGDTKAWAKWLDEHDPDLAKELDAGGFDAKAWEKRLAGINWSKGDAERGHDVFMKATCAACHDGGRAAGPSLLGIGKRFGRDDLLTAILQPNKDVSARYRMTRVVTTEETVFTGVLVYEATDGVILQTSADTTVRIAGDRIASKTQVDASIMPAGLIDKLTDGEIADLLAYLSALTDPKPK